MDFDTTTVRTTSLDSYFQANGIAQPKIIKIDTQGAEWEAWLGLANTVAASPPTLMSEFTPWTFEGRSTPLAFLEELSRHYAIVNINPKNMTGSFADAGKQAAEIAPADFAAFIGTVETNGYGWTDILCVPKALPNGSALISKLVGG